MIYHIRIDWPTEEWYVEIPADSEAEAIEKARARFPEAQEIEVEGWS